MIKRLLSALVFVFLTGAASAPPVTATSHIAQATLTSFNTVAEAVTAIASIDEDRAMAELLKG